MSPCREREGERESAGARGSVCMVCLQFEREKCRARETGSHWGAQSYQQHSHIDQNVRESMYPLHTEIPPPLDALTAPCSYTLLSCCSSPSIATANFASHLFIHSSASCSNHILRQCALTDPPATFRNVFTFFFTHFNGLAMLCNNWLTNNNLWLLLFPNWLLPLQNTRLWRKFSPGNTKMVLHKLVCVLWVCLSVCLSDPPLLKCSEFTADF